MLKDKEIQQIADSYNKELKKMCRKAKKAVTKELEEYYADDIDPLCIALEIADEYLDKIKNSCLMITIMDIEKAQKAAAKKK